MVILIPLVQTLCVCNLQTYDRVENVAKSNLTDFSTSPTLWILEFRTSKLYSISYTYIAALITARIGFCTIIIAYHFYFHCSNCQHIIGIDVCVKGRLIGCYALGMCLWRWRLRVIIFYTHTHTHTHIYIYIYIYIYIFTFTKHVTNITNKLCNARYLKYSDMEFKVVYQPFRKNKVSLCWRSPIR
jgi:hypothetical protein